MHLWCRYGEYVYTYVAGRRWCDGHRGARPLAKCAKLGSVGMDYNTQKQTRARSGSRNECINAWYIHPYGVFLWPWDTYAPSHTFARYDTLVVLDVFAYSLRTQAQV